MSKVHVVVIIIVAVVVVVNVIDVVAVITAAAAAVDINVESDALQSHVGVVGKRDARASHATRRQA